MRTPSVAAKLPLANVPGTRDQRFPVSETASFNSIVLPGYLYHESIQQLANGN
jgi:hypothetical protein